MQKKKKKKNILLWVSGTLLLLVVSAGIFAFSIISKPFSLSETVYIYIDGQKKYEDVVTQIRDKAGFPSEKIFRMMAERMNYPNKVKTGRYAINDGMTMSDVIRLLRWGARHRLILPSTTCVLRKTLPGVYPNS